MVEGKSQEEVEEEAEGVSDSWQMEHVYIWVFVLNEFILNSITLYFPIEALVIFHPSPDKSNRYVTVYEDENL